MSTPLFTLMLWFAAIGSGLMAGIYFAFSAFIMKSFGRMDTTHAITAMNAINETILRTWFMPLFFGTSIVSVLLSSFSIIHWNEIGTGLGLMAGIVYFVGMFICTVVFNVPLNNSLARANPGSDESRQIWSHYLKTWTSWNHLRTLSSLICCILCIRVLTMQV